MGFVIGMESHCSLQPQAVSSFVVSSRYRKKQACCFCSRGTDDDEFNGVGKRRAFLLFGVSVVPHLLHQWKLKANALEDVAAVGNILSRKRLSSVSEEINAKTMTTATITITKPLSNYNGVDSMDPSLKNPKEEDGNVESTQPNPFTLLNELGVFSSGTLGALYALGLKEKEAAAATVESVRNSLKEKENEISSLEERYKAMQVKEQEELTKAMKKSNEENQCTIVQLNLSNTTISAMEEEIKNEKHLVNGLKTERDAILAKLSKAKEANILLGENLEDKICLVENLEERVSLLSSELKLKEENIRCVSLNLASKELEWIDVNSSYKKTKDELAKAHLEIEELRNNVLNSQKDLNSKITVINELNLVISTLVSEKDDASRKLVDVEKELIDSRAASEKKATDDAILLEEKQKEFHLLSEQLKRHQTQSMGNEKVISELMNERGVVEKRLDMEVSELDSLNQELSMTKELLVKSTEEALNLTKQLGVSKKVSAGIEAELSTIQAKYAAEMSVLQKSLGDAKEREEELVGQVSSAKALLERKKDELQKVSQELTSAHENRDNLRKELVDVYKKAESAANAMKQQKKLLSSLKKEVEALKKQVMEDKKASETLRAELEEATRFLYQTKQNILILGRDLEVSNSQITTLKNEREALYESTTEQNKASEEVQGNLKDTHDLVMMLGKERKNLNKRSKRLEEELASAKGEILCLRSEISSPKPVVDGESPPAAKVKEKVTVSAKKNVRRRRGTASE